MRKKKRKKAKGESKTARRTGTEDMNERDWKIGRNTEDPEGE